MGFIYFSDGTQQLTDGEGNPVRQFKLTLNQGAPTVGKYIISSCTVSIPDGAGIPGPRVELWRTSKMGQPFEHARFVGAMAETPGGNWSLEKEYAVGACDATASPADTNLWVYIPEGTATSCHWTLDVRND